MDLDVNEILRYLSYEGELDNETQKTIDKAIDIVKSKSTFKYSYRIFDLSFDNNGIYFSGKNIESKVLVNYFSGCNQIIILAATLGIELDKYIRKLEITDIGLAYVVNAVATEYIEKCLEHLCRDIEQYNKYYTARFSIGYHDVSMDYQKVLVDLVEATKLIGINVLESNLMVPSKSVTAMIGVSDIPVEKQRAKCKNCLPNGKCSFNCIKEVV